jgi:putative ABC transport system permease protein
VTRLMLVKLVRDLRSARARVVLMIVAIDVSLVLFGSVLYLRVIVDRDVGPDYMGTNPASATLLLDHGLSPGELAAVRSEVRARPGVVDATLRTQLIAQTQTRTGQWSPVPLQLFVAAPDDPMRLSRFHVEQGAWPPPADGVLIERDALGVLQVSVGDRLVVEAAGGRPVALRVTGVVDDPSLAPASQEQKGYGYITTASLPLLSQPSALDELKIQVSSATGTTPDAVARTARSLGAWLEQTHGIGVEQIQVPPDQNPHQGWMDKILQALLVFGAASTLFSALLVAAMLNGLLSRQVRQIGMLKAIGARPRHVLQQYLTMTLIVAAAATALAFFPALALGRLLSEALLSSELNMDVTNFDPPWWSYAVVVATGVFLPLLMALVPLVRACRTTVREALDDHGVERGQFTPGRLDIWLTRVGTLDRTLLIGLRNVVRHRSRHLILGGLLVAAGCLFIGGLDAWMGIQATADQAAGQQHQDVQVRLGRPASAATLTSIVARVAGVTHVEAWTMTAMTVHDPGQIDVAGTYPDQGHGASFVVAVPPDTSVVTHSMVAGRWLRAADVDAVVLPQGLLPSVHLGDTVHLSAGGRPTTWHVVGILNEVGALAYVPTAGYGRAVGPPGQANLVQIVTGRHDPGTRASVAQAADRDLESASISVQVSQPATYFQEVIDGHVYVLATVVVMLAAVMAVVGCIGLAATMSANVVERTREFGVMHAIGARAGAVRRIVVAEGLFIALASCAISIVVALPATAALDAAIGTVFGLALPFQVSVTGVLAWLVAVVLGAALATLAPAWRASRLTVREALAHL